jgi:hypothetical protein
MHLASHDLNGETQQIDLTGFSFNHYLTATRLYSAVITMLIGALAIHICESAALAILFLKSRFVTSVKLYPSGS